MMGKNIFLCLLITPFLSAHSKKSAPVTINWTPAKVAAVTTATVGGAALGLIIGAVATIKDFKIESRKAGACASVAISIVTFGALGAMLTREILRLSEDNPSTTDNNSEKSTTLP